MTVDNRKVWNSMLKDTKMKKLMAEVFIRKLTIEELEEIKTFIKNIK